MFKQLLARPGVRHTLFALAGFFLVVVLYFRPALSGKKLGASDVVLVQGMQQDIREHMQQHGNDPYWTKSMFSGMPSYTILAPYRSNLLRIWVSNLAETIGYAILYPFLGLLLGFFLLRHLGANVALAAAGALAYVFASYHMIILEAGHLSKFVVLMFAPGVLWGLFLAFSRRWLSGALVLGFSLCLQLGNNHIQMVYYQMFVVMALVLWWLVRALREKQLKNFALGSAVALGAAGLAAAMNLQALGSTYEYKTYTIRGPNELTKPTEELAGAPPDSGTRFRREEGLDTAYAYAWSNGRSELLTLLVPNFMGGASGGVIDAKHKSIDNLNKVDPGGQVAQSVIGQPWDAYRGSQAFTSGPFYLGAVVVFLFLLGLQLARHSLGVPLLMVSVLGLALSLGSNSITPVQTLVLLLLPLVFELAKRRVPLQPVVFGLVLAAAGLLLVQLLDPGTPLGTTYKISDFFFENLPLYNSFRVPASMLVIVSMAVPWVALLGAQRLLDADLDPRTKLRALYVSAGVVGGLCLLMAVLPDLFGPFSKAAELAELRKPNVDPRLRAYFEGMADQRAHMMAMDAWRSLGFVLAAAVLLFVFVTGRVRNAWVPSLGMVALVGLDLIVVDWRYLNHKDFAPVSVYDTNFAPDAATSFIKQKQQPPAGYFRTYPLATGNPFNDGSTPYHLLSIGGYNAAKIKRYQQLIELHLANQLPLKGGVPFYFMTRQGMGAFAVTKGVLNMLNTRYITIHPKALPPRDTTLILVHTAPDNGTRVYENPKALGPAWIVQRVRTVPSADSAAVALYTLDTRNEAVVENAAPADLQGLATDSVTGAEQVVLKHVQNDALVYEYSSPKRRFVVFSEVYYPKGWEATIDGQPAKILQTNFVLRGLSVPAGKHEIGFRYRPASIYAYGAVALGANLVYLFGLVLAIGLAYRAWKRGAGTSS